MVHKSRGDAENAGPENAGPENAGPSRNAASLCCICMAKWTVTSSKGISVILSWFLMNTRHTWKEVRSKRHEVARQHQHVEMICRRVERLITRRRHVDFMVT